MKITERRLRSIIRSVIKESNKEHKFTHWYENFHDEVNLMGKSYKNDPKRYLNQLGVVLEKANQWGGPLDPEFKGADEFVERVKYFKEKCISKEDFNKQLNTIHKKIPDNNRQLQGFRMLEALNILLNEGVLSLDKLGSLDSKSDNKIYINFATRRGSVMCTINNEIYILHPGLGLQGSVDYERLSQNRRAREEEDRKTAERIKMAKAKQSESNKDLPWYDYLR